MLRPARRRRVTTASEPQALARAERRLEGARLVAAASVALLAMSALVFAVEGTGEEGLRAWIRWTARTSLLLFLATFVASSLRRLWRAPASAWLLRNRRYVGLSFAVSHALHLVGILALAATVPAATFAPLTVAGGGLGYAFVAAMAATSSDAAVRRLGARRWRLLHRTGSWVIFVIFAQSYLPAPFANPAYAPLGLAVAAALALRVAAWWRGRAARA
jgi:DMSO/TMAO reductase YedYZ heme-binding membrane subunit